MRGLSDFRDALLLFVEDVEAAGGLEVIRDADAWNPEARTYAPSGALDWPDLARSYLHACRVLGRNPLIQDT